MNYYQSPPPPRLITTGYLSPRRFLFPLIAAAAMIMLTGCPSPDGGGVSPGNPDSPGRTLSFTLELSEPNGNPLELGSGPSLITVTSDTGTAAISKVRRKTYTITVTQVPPNAVTLTLTVKKKGFLDTAIGPINIPPKSNPTPQTKTIPYAHTTTITGKVTTPAGKAVTQYDRAAGRSVPSADDAEVRASTDPAAKAAVAADGSFTLNVKHPGSFTLSVEYPAGRDYKAGAPQTVTTTAAAHTRNIPLSYGYTITLSGRVVGFNSSGDGSPRNGAMVTAAVEDRVVNSTTSSGTNAAGNPLGNYRITFNHPGTFRAEANFPGLRDEVFSPVRLTTETYTNNFTLYP